MSSALRAEFARGDGRIKRKEDDRRKHIQPSETLFVVNFHEETTKREDLQMLFEPFGELVRIDMKRNYAFVQFRTIEEASRAREVTDGGKLDQSVLTVEFVARQRGDQDLRRRRRDDRGDRRGGERRGGPDRFRNPPYDRLDRGGSSSGGDRYDRDRYDDFRGGRDDFRGRGRDRSPGGYRSGSPGAYRGASPGRYRGGSPAGGYRGRSRSRSRSPRGYRSRSPPRGGRYDERDRGGRYDDYRDSGGRPDSYRDRGRGPERSPERDIYRGGRDDRGYRP